MPRANRCFLPGHVWHITHRCHQRDFLLRFAQDRRRWLHWLYEARTRYGLCVLNYIVTSNHIHLLVQDRGDGEVARSMQLIAGRTAQEYNQRKSRRGSFWEDRYHATAVDTVGYLGRCMAYIDLNMVRAGAVSHPSEWPDSGYVELTRGRSRYRIIDTERLLALFRISDLASFREAYAGWTEEALRAEPGQRDEKWSASLAVGSAAFVERVKTELGVSARYRQPEPASDGWVLKDECGQYEPIFGP